MEVHITSKQMVKPSSLQLHLLKPFKLSLLDQLSPTYYVPSIFFYVKPSDSHIDASRFSNRLEQSLSKALTQFYPLSGRVKNNYFISDYDEGVPYVEARVNCRLSDFIERNQQLEALNKLLPCKPFCYVQEYSMVPLLAVQVNIFDCGGIALAFCGFHKICDATTFSALLKSWTAFSRGSNGEIPSPDLLDASSRLFPPIESMMPTTPDVKGLLFKGRLKTKSFVFDANAIAALMLKSKSKNLERPSRVVALSAFLWKHAIKASRSVSRTPKPVVLCQPVSIRQIMKPRLPDYSIGNLYLFPITTYNSLGEDIELNELAHLVKKAAESVTNNSHDLMQAFNTITEQFSQITEMLSKGHAEFYSLTSWLNVIDGEDDFGWGKPSLFRIPGVDSHNKELTNCLFLKRARQYNAIEAWITLSDKEMSVLEHDPEFLAFASPTHFDKIIM